MRIIKEAISIVPKGIDQKYNRPNPEDRWQRFSYRFKLILYSLTVKVDTIPKGVHSFLSQLTIGDLRIPEDFLLPFEVKQVRYSIGSERKLLPAHLHPDYN